MRFLPSVFLALTATVLTGSVASQAAHPPQPAQSGPAVEFSQITESLRGVSAVSRQVAWASGTHGTFLRTIDGGRTWAHAQVPDATALDFRGVVAFSADDAFLMSSGPGEQSRIYHTNDGGEHWELQFTNTKPKGFFDAIAFWNPKHGIVLGDPVPDDAGKLKFEVLVTDDGQKWHSISAQLPEAIAGEGAFAASNSSIAILTGTPNIATVNTGNANTATASPDPNIWFATGGKAARVFHSGDGGKTWEVADTPVVHGSDSAGIFSIAFRDAEHGVIAGGDYKHPNDDGPNLAFTRDGGRTWELSDLHPLAYFSAVAYDRQYEAAAKRLAAEEKAGAAGGNKKWLRRTPPERIFIAGMDFIFDFRPPENPRRIGGKKKQGIGFNALSAYPEGGVLAVGPKGSIAFIP